NLDEAAVGLARRDESLVRDAVLDDEDARGRAVGLDGGGGDERRRVGLRQKDSDGCELSGLEKVLGVLDLGLDRERARLLRDVRRDARDAPRETPGGVSAHGDRHALAVVHGRDGLFGYVYSDAQRVRADDRGGRRACGTV